MREFITAGRFENGECVVIALYDSHAKAEEAAPKVEELSRHFEHVLVSAPVSEDYSVFIHETSG